MKRLIVYFLLAYLLSWVIWLPLYAPAIGLGTMPVLPYHHAIGAFGPFLAAIITTVLFDMKALPALLNKCFSLGNIVMLQVALFAPFLIAVAAISIVGLFGSGNFDFSSIGTSNEFPGWGLLMFTAYNIFTFGYGEEMGWRGYALPKLQQRFSALQSSLILTVFWALWHLPLFLYRPGYVSMDMAGMIGWLLSLLTGSILLTWLFNTSKGSILICALFHATVDVAFTSANMDAATVSFMGAIITIWGVLTILIFKGKDLSVNPRFKFLEYFNHKTDDNQHSL